MIIKFYSLENSKYRNQSKFTLSKSQLNYLFQKNINQMPPKKNNRNPQPTDPNNSLGLKCKFNENLSLLELKQLQRISKRLRLNKPVWHVEAQNASQFKKVLQKIQHTSCTALLVRQKDSYRQQGANRVRKQAQNFLMDFKHLAPIRWINLTELQLHDTQIISLQSFSYLDVPQLQALRITNTMLSSVQPLHKLNFRHLRFVLIEGHIVSGTLQVCSRLPIVSKQFKSDNPFFNDVSIMIFHTNSVQLQQPFLSFYFKFEIPFQIIFEWNIQRLGLNLLNRGILQDQKQLVQRYFDMMRQAYLKYQSQSQSPDNYNENQQERLESLAKFVRSWGWLALAVRVNP